MDENSIIESWRSNAAPWIQAVREQQIESRRSVTDRAIVDAVLATSPRQVLDIGCGEGWLARTLHKHGVSVTGIDVVPELVQAANKAGGGEFLVMDYEMLGKAAFDHRFDALVCNFSLIGKSAAELVFSAAAGLLEDGGRLLIQTLHPVAACGEAPYQDGWREGSWAGFDPTFRDPPPWYFRTMAGWVDLIHSHGLTLESLKEPCHSAGSQPASVIFVISNKA